MRYWLILCWLLAASLWGCLEAIRRSPPDHPAPAWVAARPDSGAVLPVKRPPAPAVAKHAAPGAKQVNEYAYWCIGKGLWQEARLHLEQAVQRDSLTASYHNNLAIIYEHLGLEEQAAVAYRQAQALRPGQEAYQANIRHFEHRQRAAHPDSAAPPQTDHQPSTGD